MQLLYVTSLEEFIEIDEGTSIIYEDPLFVSFPTYVPKGKGYVFGGKTPCCARVFVDTAQILYMSK